MNTSPQFIAVGLPVARATDPAKVRLVADGPHVYALAPQADLDRSVNYSDGALRAALADGELSADEVEPGFKYAGLSVLALIALL